MFEWLVSLYCGLGCPLLVVTSGVLTWCHALLYVSGFLCCFSVSTDMIWYTDIWRVNVLCVKTGSTTVLKFCNKKKKSCFKQALQTISHSALRSDSPPSLQQPDLIYEQLLGTWWCCTVTWKVLLFLFFLFSQTLCVLVKYFEINRISWEGIF